MKTLDVKEVKDIATGSHPSKFELWVTFMFKDGGYSVFHLPEHVCESLETSLRLTRERYLPWIKENFELVSSSDSIWKCCTCGEVIEGNAAEGGLVWQLQKHLGEKHS
jgi:hypothetical protein